MIKQSDYHLQETQINFLSPKTLALMYGEGGTHFVRDVLGIKAKAPAVLLKELLKNK